MIGNDIGKLFSLTLRITIGLLLGALATVLIVVYFAAPHLPWRVGSTLQRYLCGSGASRKCSARQAGSQF